MRGAQFQRGREGDREFEWFGDFGDGGSRNRAMTHRLPKWRASVAVGSNGLRLHDHCKSELDEIVTPPSRA